MTTSIEIQKQIVDLTLQGLSHEAVCKQLNVSKNTVIKYLRQYNIISPKYDYKEITPELLQQIQDYYNEVKSCKKVCKEFHISFERLRKYIIFDKSKEKKLVHKPKDTAKRYKQLLVEYKGGKCQICGYNKCVQAMDFHHIDPNIKSFQISGGTKSLNKLKQEVDKCILLCSNCHRELHAGLIDINNFI